ncbi:MAG: hypothetical protein FD128_733, partial [Hyphomonadaceae bacterium]
LPGGLILKWARGAADNPSDAYTVRAIAAYLANGVLFAIGGTANPITEKVPGSDSMISVDIKLVDILASQITFGNTNISNPPATTSKPGVIEIATPIEALDGIAPNLAITPATLKAYIDAKIAEGIDAAKLGGQLPAYYAAINARLGYVAANAADLMNVWRATNDGSGSGLDADLLDGYDAADFALVASFAKTAMATGSQSLPGGLILKWARGAADNPSDA